MNDEMKEILNSAKEFINDPEYKKMVRRGIAQDFIIFIVKLIVTVLAVCIAVLAMSGCATRPETLYSQEEPIVSEINIVNDNESLIAEAHKYSCYIHGYRYDDNGAEEELWASPEFWEEYQYNGGRIVLVELCDNMSLEGGGEIK